MCINCFLLRTFEILNSSNIKYLDMEHDDIKILIYAFGKLDENTDIKYH